MTVLIGLETVLLIILTVLVAGLLRAYASVLRRLHALDGGAGAAPPFRLEAATPDLAAPPAPPAPRADWTSGHDITGQTVGGELVTTRVISVDADSVLLFLSSGCPSCESFWAELSRPVELPVGTRLVVITQGEDAESRRVLADLAPPGLDVIMSTSAWRDYEVPGSPHVVYVEGRTGRVRGEGTGQSWAQVAQLVARAGGEHAGRSRATAPWGQAQAAAQVDRELLAAGIRPGDPRLYGGGA